MVGGKARRSMWAEYHYKNSINLRNRDSRSLMIYVGLLVFITAFFTLMVLDNNGVGYGVYLEEDLNKKEGGFAFTSPEALDFQFDMSRGINAPSNVIASEGLPVVNIVWAAPSDGALIVKYNIYRSGSPGVAVSTNNYLGSVGGTQLFYDDFLAIPEQTFYYVVTAENFQGESLASNEDSGTVARF